MANGSLNITLIQPDIKWEDKQYNLEHYRTLIEEIKEKKEIVVLPEMFSTGFSMSPDKLAEPMNGKSVQWMLDIAAACRCIVTGSLIIEQNGHYYNRMLWVQPNGELWYYDKRHLFGYAGENNYYSSGDKRVIVRVNGWRICLMVCYDLRFPVWSRIQDEGYDVLIYAANWPEKRSLAWKTLLQARAIENMCYVAGVNRVGDDGNNIHYNGESSLFGPLGEVLWQQAGKEAVQTITLQKETLESVRSHFPFLKDADKFLLI